MTATTTTQLMATATAAAIVTMMMMQPSTWPMTTRSLHPLMGLPAVVPAALHRHLSRRVVLAAGDATAPIAMITAIMMQSTTMMPAASRRALFGLLATMPLRTQWAICWVCRLLHCFNQLPLLCSEATRLSSKKMVATIMMMAAMLVVTQTLVRVPVAATRW